MQIATFEKTTHHPGAPTAERLPTRGQSVREVNTRLPGAPGFEVVDGRNTGPASRFYDGSSYTTITERQALMRLDRPAQLKILQLLEETFPMWRDTQRADAYGMDLVALNYQLAYLEQHGLVKCNWSKALSGGRCCLWAEITAAGLDFIADDGGLTAVLGTVTIKIDSTQWAELLASKVERLEGVSHEERSSIASTLRNLPAKAIERVSEKMLDWAVDHAQDALPLLRTLLTQAVG